MAATEQDFLLRKSSTLEPEQLEQQALYLSRRSTEPHDQPGWPQLQKLHFQLGALLFVVFVFCAGAYVSDMDLRGSKNRVIPGGYDPTTVGGRRVSKYDASQFISFSINTLGGLDAHG